MKQKRPMKVCLWGAWYGSKNTGDQAMLIAITKSLRKIDKDVKIVVLSENAKYIINYMNEVGLEIDALNKWEQFPKMLSALREACVLCIGGGVPFYDSLSHIIVFVFLIVLSKLCRVRIMTYAPSTQKLNHPLSRWAYRIILNNLDLITIREAWSIKQIKELDIRKNIIFTADSAIGLEPAPQKRINEILQKEGLDKDKTRPLIGVTTRRLRATHKKAGAHYRKISEKDIDNFQNVVANTCDYLATLGKVVFIPMNTADFDDDREMAKEIVCKMKKGNEAKIIVKKYTALEMMGLLGSCSFVLANRVHSIILAASCGVPFVSIAYDYKFIGITERFNLAENNIDLIDINAEDVIEKVHVVWKDREIISKRLKERTKELKKLVELNAKLAVSLCKNKKIEYAKLNDYCV
jgi:polysaccharide pyruvyl transferase WcaK-like protein